MHEPVTKTLLKAISPTMREYLFQHIDGPVPIEKGDRTDKRYAVRNAARSRRFLKGIPSDAFPKSTALTELGRDVVAHLLAEYAEVLVAAGFLYGEAGPRPLEVLRALKARRPGAMQEEEEVVEIFLKEAGHGNGTSI